MNLYLHIPFCASRCSYCDFYTQTGSRLRRDFLGALIRELHLRRVELPDGALIDHIYFGGGTPSLLTPEELTRIFDTITELYPLTGTGEVTIECNPDDVTEEYAQALGVLPINRVSMGVQSFHADDLTFLNRRHSAEQVVAAVEALRRHNTRNLSLDLIYGLPGQTEERWLTHIRTFLSLGVPHLSAYHLIYEEGTALTRLVERGKVQPVTEEASLRFFELLISELKADYTIVIVTHNMQQASRVSDMTGFFNLEATGKPGHLVEYDSTDKIFSAPSQQATEDYISGRFG